MATVTRSRMEVVCCILILLSTRVAESYSSYCPDGFCRHSGNCYLVVGLNATWMEARSYCTVLGGSLLSVSSEAQQTAVEGVMTRSQGLVFPGNYWLDTTDLLNPGEWKWMASKTALSYTNWLLDADTRHNSSGNCVDMWTSWQYEWTTANCMERRNFVCYKTGTPRQNRRYGYYGQQEDVDDVIDCL